MLDHISLFIKVIEKGTLSEASKALGIGKATASRKLDQLEAELGCKLMIRSSRGIMMTDAGKILFEQSRIPIKQIANLTESIIQDTQELAGTIKITTALEFVQSILSSVFILFMQRFPHIKIEISVLDPKAIINFYDYDIAFLPSIRGNENFVAKTICPINLKFYASTYYFLNQKRNIPLSPEQLSEHNLLVNQALLQHQSIKLNADQQHFSLISDHVTFSASNYRLLYEICLNHGGIALLPDIMVRSSLSKNLLIPILPDWSVAHGQLFMLYPTGYFISKRVKLLTQFIMQHWSTLSIKLN